MISEVELCKEWIHNTYSKQFHRPQLLTHELIDSIKRDGEALGLSVTSAINPYSSSIKVFWQSRGLIRFFSQHFTPIQNFTKNRSILLKR